MPGGLIAGWNPTLRRALIVGVAVGLALLLLAGTLVQWRLPRFLFGSRPTGPQSSGPAAPWQSMVMLAFQEAAKIDKQAALHDVEADTPGTFHNIAYAGPVTGSLQVRFSFYRPNGDSFWIDFEDGDPARTQFVYPGEGRGSSGGQTNYRTAQSTDQTYRQNVQSVKLSPRDAVERTWNLARTEADRHGLQGRKLDPDISISKFNKPGKPVWEVTYWLVPVPLPKGQPSPTPDPRVGDISGMVSDLLGVNLGSLSGGLVVSYDVDGTSGQVIRTHHFLDPEPSPTP